MQNVYINIIYFISNDLAINSFGRLSTFFLCIYYHRCHHACMIACSGCLLTFVGIHFSLSLCLCVCVCLYVCVLNEVHLKISSLIPISEEGYNFFSIWINSRNLKHFEIISIIGMLLSYLHFNATTYVWHS